MKDLITRLKEEFYEFKISYNRVRDTFAIQATKQCEHGLKWARCRFTSEMIDDDQMLEHIVNEISEAVDSAKLTQEQREMIYEDCNPPDPLSWNL